MARLTVGTEVRTECGGIGVVVEVAEPYIHCPDGRLLYDVRLDGCPGIQVYYDYELEVVDDE